MTRQHVDRRTPEEPLNAPCLSSHGAAAASDALSEASEAAAAASPAARLADARAALAEAREREVLLLEAYEQLERDVGAEVDRALAKQVRCRSNTPQMMAVLRALTFCQSGSR